MKPMTSTEHDFPIFSGRWTTCMMILTGMTLLLLSLQASGQGLGKVEAVYESELPYFSEDGAFLGVLTVTDKHKFNEQEVAGQAPRGLVKLKDTETQEFRWFRAIHFKISGGPMIDCPDMLVAESGSTKRPVSHNMENGCDKKKSSQ